MLLWINYLRRKFWPPSKKTEDSSVFLFVFLCMTNKNNFAFNMKNLALAFFRNIPIYLIVIVLALAALPKGLFTPLEAPSNNLPKPVGVVGTVGTVPVVERKVTDGDQGSKAVADIARITIDAVKDKYDSLKDLYEKLFSVIAALGALFAFLGFKGADSFIQAKHKAEETLKKAEESQAKMDKFLTEIYPRNNKAEVNVTTGIVLRHIADAYSKIIKKTSPDHELLNDKDYQNFLNSALYYLDSVDEATGIDDALRNRTASTKGNIYKRLGEYERAIAVLEQRVKSGVADDDSIIFNLACYYTLKAEKEAGKGNHAKAAEAEQKALEYLATAISMNNENKALCATDCDFSYFVSKKDQRFNSLVGAKESTPCPMKGSQDCPIK